MIYYIGSFPPPFGGVNNKNQLIYEEMSARMAITKLDLRRTTQGKLITFFLKFIFHPKDGYIFGWGNRKIQRWFTCICYFVNRSALRRSVLIVMGGTFGKTVMANRLYQKAIRHYGQIFVETKGMMRELAPLGYSNIDWLPNFRKMAEPLPLPQEHGKLQCLFFSYITREKGIYAILEAARMLLKSSTCEFTFYGPINPADESHFTNEIKGLKNCRYMGVFDTVQCDIFNCLCEYDVLLLPTRHINEGMPGALVESKAAGLAAIVSDANYNTEIVHHGKDGIILANDEPETLAKAIASLDRDRQALRAMKENALRSASEYDVLRHIGKLTRAVMGDTSHDI